MGPWPMGPWEAHPYAETSQRRVHPYAEPLTPSASQRRALPTPSAPYTKRSLRRALPMPSPLDLILARVSRGLGFLGRLVERQVALGFEVCLFCLVWRGRGAWVSLLSTRSLEGLEFACVVCFGFGSPPGRLEHIRVPLVFCLLLFLVGPLSVFVHIVDHSTSVRGWCVVSNPPLCAAGAR